MSADRKYDTIMEGCSPNTPSKLMYAQLPSHIPENVRVLTIGNGKYREKDKYVLFSKTKDFHDYELEDVPDVVEGGFPIDNIFGLPLWAIFDAQRSFTTRDGRMYIESGYFEENWRWYLDNVPTILDTCGKLFNKEVTESEINQNPESAF